MIYSNDVFRKGMSPTVTRKAKMDSNFTESTSVGGFGNRSASGDYFDDKFQRICEEFLKEGVDLRTDSTTLIQDDAMYESFKEALIGDVRDACTTMLTEEAADMDVYYGDNTSLYDQVSQLMDNTRYVHENALMLGQLLPIKNIDYPLLVKNHLGLVGKEILKTEVVNSPVIKKHIEQQWIVSNQDPDKRWRFPQCFYEVNPETGIPFAQEIFGEGVGYPIKETPVQLPINNFNIASELTDAPIPGRESLNLNIKIDRISLTLPEAGVDVEYKLPQPIRVDFSHGHYFHGGTDVTYHIPYETTDDETGETTIAYEDVAVNIYGSLDTRTGNVTIIDALNDDLISVVFVGFLSNEKNERSTRVEWSRDEVEWHIPDGFRQMNSFSLEELQDTKALLNFDLYQRAYKLMADIQADMEDSDIFAYLDGTYEGLASIGVEEKDIMGWDGFGFEDAFDCDPSTMTTMSPVEWISEMLKFKIDGIIADMIDMLKCEDYTFVIYANPRIIRLLSPKVNWIQRSGSNVAGVKLNYSYGVMTSQNYHVQVISAAKVLHEYDEDAKEFKGLRIIAYPTTKERYTMMHYKYTSNIETPQTSAYRDPNLPGGSKSYVMCTSRWLNAEVQPIMVGINIQNAERYISTTNK